MDATQRLTYQMETTRSTIPGQMPLSTAGGPSLMHVCHVPPACCILPQGMGATQEPGGTLRWRTQMEMTRSTIPGQTQPSTA